MVFSTFLTLIIVPVVYTLLARFTKSKERVSNKEKASTHTFDPIPVIDK